MPTEKSRPWLQFSLRTLFWTFLSIALGFAAYRRGLTVGEQVGFQKGEEAWLLKEPNSNWTQKVYRVSDLLDPGKDPQLSADVLASSIRANVLPSSWDGRGGTITFFKATGEVVINQHPITHARIERYLNQRRLQQKNAIAKK